MKQRTFASLSFDSKKKPTRREKFLAEMDRVVPYVVAPAQLEQGNVFLADKSAVVSQFAENCLVVVRPRYGKVGV